MVWYWTCYEKDGSERTRYVAACGRCLTPLPNHQGMLLFDTAEKALQSACEAGWHPTEPCMNRWCNHILCPRCQKLP
jgi:hypothetical protein